MNHNKPQKPKTESISSETISEKVEKNDIAHKIGDIIERAGEKVKNAGAEKLGSAIYKAGNKIEHMNGQKKP